MRVSNLGENLWIYKLILKASQMEILFDWNHVHLLHVCTILTQMKDFEKKVRRVKYKGSNISSTESDVNIGRGKKWTTDARSITICKSDLSNKIK